MFDVSRRILAAVLSLLTLLPLLASCGDASGDAPVVAAAETAAEVTTAEETTVSYDPKLPPADYDGRTFTILYEKGSEVEPNKDFLATELTGEIVNDAIWNRHLFLTEKYGLNFVYLSGDNSGVKKTVSGGEDAYQIFDGNAQNIMSVAMQGMMLEVHDIPLVDLDKPYWSEEMLSGSSLSHKNYFLFSDASVHAYGATPCMIFNKVVHQNFGLDDLYGIVLDGGWNFDRTCEMVSAVTNDLDGDGVITKDDCLGLIANNFCVDCFISGSGYHTVDKDGDDLPFLNVQTEKFAGIMDGIKRVCSEETGTFLVDRTSTATEAREYWTEQAITSDRALFWVGNLKCVERMRQSESDFGVVPMPKSDETQEDYAIHVQANVGTMLGFPITNADTELLGMVLEDMAYYSYVNVMPAYMDVCIDGKAIRDEESLACLKIIRSAYFCDLGYMLQGSGITILGDMRNYVTKNQDAFLSTIEKSAQKWSASLEKVIATVTE